MTSHRKQCNVICSLKASYKRATLEVEGVQSPNQKDEHQINKKKSGFSLGYTLG